MSMVANVAYGSTAAGHCPLNGGVAWPLLPGLSKVNPLPAVSFSGNQYFESLLYQKEAAA